ncbi:toll/interleukin-1 receptor domain-containing protein [Kaistella sp. G5-32]|uniref:Toll/interleukin-1 receptor domain-containing protein n=1 Tax=Kaistella gelatinilytica TaxID=2787636 RepID=A0ABS0FAH6_9FLAO|nr:toll/interleukin-1 receptor domain-containing protein [Kaistella gelatinilytica]MBF8456717.1 toll/interleukin-1 receptor domain-containing protein [Kaistella gelatinilytica]
MVKKGYNKAKFVDSFKWLLDTLEDKELEKRPCIFWSHKREDKPACRKIAEYLKDAGVDYYLDEEDAGLQSASTENNPEKITESIKKGISESTHMLVVISEKTYSSQWVPFEVGYGHATILDKDASENKQKNKIQLAILTLQDISEKTLPDYLQVGYIIRGTKSINEYISEISGKTEGTMINETRIFSNIKSYHPLDNVLNWRL